MYYPTPAVTEKVRLRDEASALFFKPNTKVESYVAGADAAPQCTRLRNDSVAVFDAVAAFASVAYIE